MCQYNVGKVLEPVRQAFPWASIIHYMNDLTSKEEEQYSIYDKAKDMLHKNGLIITPEGVQRSETVQYLGQLLTRTTINLYPPDM